MGRCPECGGSLVLDGAAAQYVCDHCHSEYAIPENDAAYERYRSEQQAVKRRKQRAIRGVCIAIAVVLVAIVAVSVIPEINEEHDRSQRELMAIRENQVCLPLSASDYHDEDAITVGTELCNAGFKKVEFTKIDDVFVIDPGHRQGKIERVSIDGRTTFKAGEWVSKDAKVLISYHSKSGDPIYEPILSREGQIRLPKSAGDYHGSDANNLAEELRFYGFANVDEPIPMDDLNFASGVIWREGTVGDIAINGNSSFGAGEWFPSESHVLIYFHSYPSDDEEK